MKAIYGLVIILVLPVCCAYTQTIDYNRIVLPDRATSLSFEERLVQIAWRNHPSNKIVEENVRITQKEKALANWSWLDNIYAVGNLNEFTVAGTPGDRQIFFPRYNFGVRLSLGTFVQTPIQSRIADSRMINAEFQVNEKKLELRAEVLIQLERFKESFQILNLRKGLKEEYYQSFRIAENKFQSNETTLERLQGAQESYILQTQGLITSQSRFNQEKITLEALLGLKLEDIGGYPEFIAQLEKELRQ